ncbi:hypothetical protein Ocin01_11226 [Orchesella cincta]|uniref:Uncharacterized protein n=1 Tax=Orchesella cincta TaxID=48709 RepID=A0A1D2MRD1_ORCCI|nr:hypothetical protein Ocin01_11226 [Orchesella cincta]
MEDSRKDKKVDLENESSDSQEDTLEEFTINYGSGACNFQPIIENESSKHLATDENANDFIVDSLQEGSSSTEAFSYVNERIKITYADWKKADRKSNNGSGDHSSVTSISAKSFHRKRYPERRNVDLSALWRYPTVHQSFHAYPILAKRSNTLVRARQQNEKLRRELEKDPERHELDKEDHRYSLKSPDLTLGSRKSRGSKRASSLPRNAPATGETRRKTASKLQTLENKDDAIERRNHRVSGFSRSSQGDDTLRRSRTNSKASAILYSTISGISSPLNPVLSSIRTHNEDVENNKISTKCKKCCRLCGHRCSNCMSSYRCTCVSFFLSITIVLALALTAIIYPVYKALSFVHNEHTD